MTFAQFLALTEEQELSPFHLIEDGEPYANLLLSSQKNLPHVKNQFNILKNRSRIWIPHPRKALVKPG